jgi:uncharacterized membrane protein YcaP (DUF421 family)
MIPQIIARTVFMYLVIIISMRLMGKRQIGQLQPFEFAIAVMISDLAVMPLSDNSKNLLHDLIPIIVLVICQVLISFLSIKGVRIREIICGKPMLLIRDGKLLEKNMKREMYTINDLTEQLRFNSIQSVGDVEYGILETNGQLSVFLKSGKRPATPEDFGLNPSHEKFCHDIIIDGKLIGRTLERLHIKREWVDQALKEYGVNDYKQVFYAYIDNNMKIQMQKKGEYLE